jgi:hypothetical protein
MMKTLNPNRRTSLKRLFERVEGFAGRVDRNAGIIRGVKILGKHSKNGRTYTDKALNDAVPLYEGVKVNVDHPSRDKPNAERGFMEGFGSLRNVQRKGDGVYGDLHFLKSHPSAEVICEAAERFPDQFGLSHNADGQTHYEGSQLIVESIESVQSVDIVGRPATNNGLFESTGRGMTLPRVKLGTWLKFLGYGPELRRVMEGSLYTHRDAEGNATKLSYRQDITNPRTGEVYDAEDQVKAEAELRDALGDDISMIDANGNGIPDDQEGTRDTSELKAAFRAAVAAVFDDDSLTTGEMLAKIKAILKLQDKLLAAVGGGSGEADPADEGKSFTESLKSGGRPAYTGITANSSTHVPYSPFMESLNRKHAQKLAERRQRAIQNGSLREYREDRQQDHQPSSGGEAYYTKTPAELVESLSRPTVSPLQARLDEAQRRRHEAAKRKRALQESQRQKASGSSLQPLYEPGSTIRCLGMSPRTYGRFRNKDKR